MKPIGFSIIKPRQTLEKQWGYLVQRGRDNKRFALKRFLVVLLVITGLYFLIYFMTEVNHFIGFKVVSGTLIVTGCYGLMILYLLLIWNKLGKQRRFGKFLDSFTERQLNYSVEIDEDKIILVSTDRTSELPWKNFDWFGINDETIYIFNDVEKINSLYWNMSEMGSEAFLNLFDLLRQKSIEQLF